MSEVHERKRVGPQLEASEVSLKAGSLAYEREKAKGLLEKLRYAHYVRAGRLGGFMQRLGDWWRNLGDA